MQEDPLNGRPYWIKENFAYGIWYSGLGQWIVGNIENLGSQLGGLGSICSEEECGYCCEDWLYMNTDGYWKPSDEIFILVNNECSLSCL